ncbi:MAG TPA: hypothetical protein DCQ31_14625 [Bacteroidales bacterium]|nr:hypothetical protein [Bacteroidales bacterium]
MKKLALITLLALVGVLFVNTVSAKYVVKVNGTTISTDFPDDDPKKSTVKKDTKGTTSADCGSKNSAACGGCGSKSTAKTTTKSDCGDKKDATKSDCGDKKSTTDKK